jgi:pterin-4a-carbinolamine dehydratase
LWKAKLCIRYNKVKLALISHVAGGLTKQDSEMARVIEALIEKKRDLKNFFF